MTILQILRAAGARVDGLTWDKDGNLAFVATNANGPWSDADKEKVLRVLGRASSRASASSF